MALRHAAACLFLLTGFAVQPLFELIGREPAFLVAHRSGPLDIVLLAALLCLGPPLLGTAVARAARAVSPTLERGVLLSGFALAAAAALLPLLVRAFPDSLFATLLPAALGGVLVAAGLWRGRALVASVAPFAAAAALFPLHFLLLSPVAALVLPPGADGGATARAVRPAPVVLAVFDGLPVSSLMDADGGIDPVRYPAFARLARRATWYRDTTTVSDLTTLSLAAILSGRFPARDAPALAAEFPDTLFPLLAGQYELFALEPVTGFCPRGLCRLQHANWSSLDGFIELLHDAGIVHLHLLLPRPLRAGLPDIEERWRMRVHRDDPALSQVAMSVDRVAEFDDFVAAIAPRPRPPLFFVHSMLPHRPWRHLPSGQVYPDPGRVRGGAGMSDRMGRWGVRWQLDEAAVRESHQRHLLQVGTADTLLGRLLDRLEATGLWDEALVIVTSDHGENFVPGESYRPVDAENADAVMSVPLFVKAPGQVRGAVSDRPARTVDIVPTLAQVLGVELPWASDGVSLLAAPGTPAEAPRERVIHARLRRPALERLRLSPPHPRESPALEKKLARFGARQHAGLYAPPAYRGDLGRPVGALRAGVASRWRFRLDAPERYEAVDPTARALPAFVSGELPGRPPTHLRLAVALNGTLRAVTWPYPEGDRSRFAALVPAESFRAGRNRVELFEVVDAAGGRELRALRPALAARDTDDAAPRPGAPGAGSGR